MVKQEKYKDLVAKDCEILDLYRSKVVVKISEKENLIAKKIGKLKKGDRVNIFKMQTVNKVEEILIYISPVYYMILGFIFGFLFSNDLFHYLLVLGMTILGFAQLFILKFVVQKLPLSFYVSVNKETKIVQNNQHSVVQNN